MLGRITSDEIRRGLRFTPACASDVGLSPDQRQQFINGTRTLPSSPYPFAPEEMMRFRRRGHDTMISDAGTFRTCGDVRFESAIRRIADMRRARSRTSIYEYTP
jgi:hypothetical protein